MLVSVAVYAAALQPEHAEKSQAVSRRRVRILNCELAEARGPEGLERLLNTVGKNCDAYPGWCECWWSRLESTCIPVRSHGCIRPWLGLMLGFVDYIGRSREMRGFAKHGLGVSGQRHHRQVRREGKQDDERRICPSRSLRYETAHVGHYSKCTYVTRVQPCPHSMNNCPVRSCAA